MTLRIFRNAFLASLAAVIACTLFFVGIMYYSTHKLAFERLSAEAEQIASALSSYGDDYINTVTCSYFIYY